VDYIRGEYGKFTQVSLSNLKRRFAKLDLNGDAALNIFEFRHAVSGMATHLEAARLSDGECDRLFEYLDAVHDGAVVWDEFQAIYLALNDPKKARALPADIRNACIKMQYASIPDPNKCVSTCVCVCLGAACVALWPACVCLWTTHACPSAPSWSHPSPWSSPWPLPPSLLVRYRTGISTCSRASRPTTASPSWPTWPSNR